MYHPNNWSSMQCCFRLRYNYRGINTTDICNSSVYKEISVSTRLGPLSRFTCLVSPETVVPSTLIRGYIYLILFCQSYCSAAEPEQWHVTLILSDPVEKLYWKGSHHVYIPQCCASATGVNTTLQRYQPLQTRRVQLKDILLCGHTGWKLATGTVFNQTGQTSPKVHERQAGDQRLRKQCSTENLMSHGVTFQTYRMHTWSHSHLVGKTQEVSVCHCISTW